MSRRPCFHLESLPAGCTRGYASRVHRESSVSRQHALPRAAVLLNTHFHGDCWCSNAAHTPSARCACRALSPELDCSGRCLAKRLHELVFTNTVPTQRPSSCSSHNQAQQCSFIVGSHQDSLEPQQRHIAENFTLPPVPFCGGLPLRGRPGASNTTTQYCATARSSVRGRCSRTPRTGSFCLWNSATAWSAEAFNTTVCGRCSRYDLQHHCVVLVPCVSFARCFTFTCSAENICMLLLCLVC